MPEFYCTGDGRCLCGGRGCPDACPKCGLISNEPICPKCQFNRNSNPEIVIRLVCPHCGEAFEASWDPVQGCLVLSNLCAHLAGSEGG